MPAKEITMKDLCELEKAPGPCRGYFEKIFFNSSVRECQMFVYGGCQGNGNNFATADECNRNCAPQNQLIMPVAAVSELPEKKFTEGDCLLAAEAGRCLAYIPSYYFDVESGRCESFVYGGCGGNNNRFSLIEQCEKACNKGW